MLQLQHGIIHDVRVKVDICPLLDHGPMRLVHAIVLHQTDSSTAASSLAKYKDKKGREHTGAHFLLDKDGTMYQTLQVDRRCAHVAPIRPRCLDEHSCTPLDEKTFKADKKKVGNDWSGTYDRLVGRYEAKKLYPLRYPFNPDAIGIEVVGRNIAGTTAYEAPTPLQDQYIHWFVKDLMATLKLTNADIFRHPKISYKTEGEAAKVTW